MTEREKKLLIAAKEILGDFDRYGEVLQTDDNGEYKMESSIGMLNTAILQYIKSPEPQHGHEPKPLAQYLGEYVDHEAEMTNIQSGIRLYEYASWQALLEQALEAYESTENVVIQIIKKKVRE